MRTTAVASTAYTKSDYTRHKVKVEQQMKHNVQPSPVDPGSTPAAAATASVRHARDQHYETSIPSISSPRHSISDAQMMALDASQKKSTPSDSRSRHQQIYSKIFHRQRRSAKSEPFIDGQEGMSLPSMSGGEKLDFYTPERERASLSRSPRIVGGKIIEDAEADCSIDEASGVHSKNPDELAPVASVIVRYMSDGHRPPQLRGPQRDTARIKKKRTSLSAYYREMKASLTIHDDDDDDDETIPCSAPNPLP